MKCKKCEKDKLSEEFPPDTMREECQHAALHCLRCVIESYEKHKQCSQCELPLSPSHMEICYSQLEALFPEIHGIEETVSEGTSGEDSGQITIKRLDGESMNVTFAKSRSIISIKDEIKQHMAIPINNQRLLYNGREVEIRTPDNSETTLSDYGIQPGATILMMVLLYEIPTQLKKIVFDLQWGYPGGQIDALDASALLFNGSKALKSDGLADFRCRNAAGYTIIHSGDVMDDVKKIGHHKIEVDLHAVPEFVTHVFFTLSAYNAATVSHYPNPTIRFYDESHPDQMLCADQTKQACNKQAVIMCSLSRIHGHWFVHDSGVLSEGNSKNYEALISTIENLIKSTSA